MGKLIRYGVQHVLDYFGLINFTNEVNAAIFCAGVVLISASALLFYATFVGKWIVHDRILIVPLIVMGLVAGLTLAAAGGIGLTNEVASDIERHIEKREKEARDAPSEQDLKMRDSDN